MVVEESVRYSITGTDARKIRHPIHLQALVVFEWGGKSATMHLISPISFIVYAIFAHCLNFLRMMVLCITLEPADVLERDFEAHTTGATHVCREWRRLLGNGRLGSLVFSSSALLSNAKGEAIIRKDNIPRSQYAERILGGIDIKLTIFMRLPEYYYNTYIRVIKTRNIEWHPPRVARRRHIATPTRTLAYSFARDALDGADANGGPTRAKWREFKCGDRDVPNRGSTHEPTWLPAASKIHPEAGGTLDECAELGRSGLDVDGDEVDVARGRR
ncbi:hypothetical protein FB451DRAFT_1513939 [Mycena latifolia]|nr:hypothetical protein FB451DRAFT_1513939 [Mycena latifolia]